MDSSPSFISRHQFLIYRLFSLAGLIPVGAYLVVHLLVNATVIDSPAKYQDQVDKIHSLGIILPAVEWIFIFIPLIFHALVGVLIVSSASFNLGSYPYTRNFRYTMQRATGMIAFVYILWHVIQMHHLGHALGGGRFDAEHATSTVAIVLTPLPIKILYAIGMLACVFHLANGTWTWGITWGIWTSKAGQRRASYLCAGFGVLLAIAGLASIGGFSAVNIEQAQQVENRLIKMHQYEEGKASLQDVETSQAKAADVATP